MRGGRTLREEHVTLPVGRPLRILVGTKEIAGQIPDYAAGFRALGHSVTTVVRERNRLFPELVYDVELGTGDESAQVLSLMQDHDVFVFQYGWSLLPGNLDLPVLRSVGKAIIAVCNGDDIRHASAYHQQFGVSAETLGEDYVKDALVRPVQTLRVMERYASLIISVPNQSGLALRPYMHFAYAMEPALYSEAVHDRDVPVVVHAPSHRATKGTAHVLASLERLRERGVRFDLQLLENRPNEVVRDTLRDADIAIDQTFVTYGKFAAEAMASGCATACVTYPELESFARLRPLWPISVATLDHDLERLLTDRALRRDLAAQGRPHVERYHDRTEVCARMLRALQAGIDGTLRYDYYPDFAAARYALPAGEELPQHQRLLASEIIAAHGLPAGVQYEDVVRRGLASPRLPGGVNTVPQWAASDGLESDGTDHARVASRYKAFRIPKRPTRSTPVQRDVVLERFHAMVSAVGASDVHEGGAAAALADALEGPLGIGLPNYAVPIADAHLGTSQASRRAVGLLQLGSGNPVAALELLAPLRAHDADGIVTYYLGVAHARLGQAELARTAWHEAVPRLQREPSMTLSCDGHTVGHYRFGDFTPAWTASGSQVALAPYHAFLFVLLGAEALQVTHAGGPLGQTPYAPLEAELLRAAGVRAEPLAT